MPEPRRPYGVDVVVVSHQSEGPLAGCLESLRADGATRIVVVDNASTDRSEAVARRFGAEWLPTGSNLGFGRAANRGIAATRSPYIFILNPDTVVRPGCIAAIAQRLAAEPTTAIVGPTVLNSDGTEYPSARAFPSLGVAIAHAFLGLIDADNRWTRRYRHPAAAEWVSGTAMVMRRGAIEQVGGFDEAYFMYMEDVDLCRRLRDAGWGVAVESTAVVVHAIGASSEQHPYRMVVAHHVSMWRYVRTTTTGASRLLIPVVVGGIFVRMLLALLQRLIRQRPHAAG